MMAEMGQFQHFLFLLTRQRTLPCAGKRRESLVILGSVVTKTRHSIYIAMGRNGQQKSAAA
jgi:hypothetical protein